MSTDTSKALETRRLLVWALAQTLKSHGYAVEVADSEPLLAIPAAFSSPVLVRCDLRAICGGEPDSPPSTRASRIPQAAGRPPRAAAPFQMAAP